MMLTYTTIMKRKIKIAGMGIGISILILLFAYSFTLYTSCKKNSCSGVTCYNGGSCGDGKCTCPSGYLGSNCQLYVTAQYVGVWNGTDCNGATTCSINYQTPTTLSVSVKTGGTCGITVYLNGIVDPISQNLTCAVQNYTDACGNPITVGATGSIVNKKLWVTYLITSAGNTNTCQ